MPMELTIEGHVAEVVINRPEVLNALDGAAYSGLSRIWTEVRDNPEIWVAIVTGAGDRAFSAGRDLKEFTASQHHEPSWRIWQTQHEQLLNRGLDVWKPVIAAVNGLCLGAGMTLLLATDIRIASVNATFGLPEVRWGLLPTNGGTQRAVRQLPYAVALEMLLTGDPIDAGEALRVGLVNRVVEPAQLLSEARGVADRICGNGPLAVRAIKELAVRSQYLHLDDGLRLESAIDRLVHLTEDSREGPAAFKEKRAPKFRGE